jgi:hypothetical protein
MTYVVAEGVRMPPLPELLFWILLLMSAELLPVSLGYQTQVTMSYPITLAAAITYSSEPAVAMIIAGLGAFDIRELRREIPVWHALFNRAQLMLTVGAASGVILLLGGGALAVAVGAVVHSLANLGLVALWVHQLRGAPLEVAVRGMFPKPVGGFLTVQALLGGLGAVTAAAYQEIGFFVAAFLIHSCSPGSASWARGRSRSSASGSGASNSPCWRQRNESSPRGRTSASASPRTFTTRACKCSPRRPMAVGTPRPFSTRARSTRRAPRS